MAKSSGGSSKELGKMKGGTTLKSGPAGIKTMFKDAIAKIGSK